ncbi:transcriptional regulator [Saccharomonospora marina XMU15]|uniref:Transcriptional regulator n=1 Tax=Saccharomonospora marina XMU15 TaxID=882083 RepID=H5X6E9_9PSEU|nr:MarR family transcriptional regulator [Saccharomonospora marina]EHR50097.1 transcriptional regulator [Saccharomonospora marina XMU15]
MTTADEDRAAVADFPTRTAAFLLAQLGAHAQSRFAERVGELGLTLPDIVLLRMIACDPGRSQRSLAAELGVVPSRVVALIDSLDARGLVDRRRCAKDRRNHALHLTAKARTLLDGVREAAAAHEDEICAALDAGERSNLTALLERMARQQGLGTDPCPPCRSRV